MNVISQKEQISIMKEIHGTTGLIDIDTIRQDMCDGFDYQYGRDNWDFIPLTPKQLSNFRNWLDSEN